MLSDEKFIVTYRRDVWYGSFPALAQAGFVNALSLRVNGASQLAPGTFNLALHVGDNNDLVLANRRRFAEALGVDAASFTTCAQVHGRKVALVTKELVGAGAMYFKETIKDTDALVTDLPGVPLLIFCADCVPVLFSDPVKGVCGVAHAGWKGTVAAIAKETVKAMQESFGCLPENILAAIGPSIGSCCYEVDDAVRDEAASWQEFFRPVFGKKGKYLFDMWGLNYSQLVDSGLKPENVFRSDVCTAHNYKLFCSYRAENSVTGRMGICIFRRS